jgi:hypothetical protein
MKPFEEMLLRYRNLLPKGKKEKLNFCPTISKSAKQRKIIQLPKPTKGSFTI